MVASLEKGEVGSSGPDLLSQVKSMGLSLDRAILEPNLDKNAVYRNLQARRLNVLACLSLWVMLCQGKVNKKSKLMHVSTNKRAPSLVDFKRVVQAGRSRMERQHCLIFRVNPWYFHFSCWSRLYEVHFESYSSIIKLFLVLFKPKVCWIHTRRSNIHPEGHKMSGHSYPQEAPPLLP
jgi:hypothetical protein